MAALGQTSTRIRLRWEKAAAYWESFGPVLGLATLCKLKLPNILPCVPAYLHSAVRRLYSEEGCLLKLDLLGEAPLYVREGTSDILTFEQVYVWQEYDIPDIPAEPDVIIDAGANIGLATRFLARKYPHAHIVCVEPDGANFQLLERNTAHLANVTRLRAAVWGSAARLEIANPDAEAWAFQVRETPDEARATTQGVTVLDLLQIAGSGRCMLKMDIEGAEQEVFGPGCHQWLASVDVIVLELHERLLPGSSASFFAAMREENFAWFTSGENTVLVRRT